MYFLNIESVVFKQKWVHPNFFGLSFFCVFAFLGSSVSEGCNRGRVGSAWVDPGSALRKTRERRAPRIRARAAEGIMSGKTQDTEFRHPEAVAFLESLTSEQAAKRPLLILDQDGVVARYWLEDGRVRCRELETDGASGDQSFEMDALHSAAEAEFGRSLPRLEAELRVGGVPDLDAIETSIRERALDLGAKTCADLLEARDAADPPPPCPSCDRRTERHSRAAS